MGRLLFFLIFCLLNISECFSITQQSEAVLRFEHTRYDFGTIAEKDGVVSHQFRFTNISNHPLAIEKVLTTCGCTVADFDKRPIQPGGTGAISVQFDPRGRTATFHKSIRVVTNHGQSVTSLFLSGAILLEETSSENVYEIADDIYLDKLTLPFGVLHHSGTMVEQVLTIQNKSARTIHLGYIVDNKNNSLSITLPKQLVAGETAKISVSAVDVPEYYGSIQNKIILLVDGIASLQPITVYGYLVDDMRNVKIADAPKCKIEKGYFNIGKVERGTRCEHEFILCNEGRTPLIIRKIESDFPIRTDFNAVKTLQPGGKITVKLSVNTQKATVVDANVWIISNDLQTPVKRLKVEGEIK